MPNLRRPQSFPVRSRTWRRAGLCPPRHSGLAHRILGAAMTEDQIRDLLEGVRSGATDVDAAVERMRHMPFEDMGFAKLDHHRALRHGLPEVVFALGKTLEQVLAITGRLAERSPNVLVTRATAECGRALAEQ